MRLGPAVVACTVLLFARPSFSAGRDARSRTRSAAPSTAAVSPESGARSAERPAGEAELQYTKPNRKLLWASSIVLGAAYVPAVIAAATSSRNADHHLYLPVLGPWAALAARACTQPASVDCSNAPLAGVGLFVDGLAQLAGIVGFVLAFVIPETRQVSSVRPASFPGHGYGLVFTLEDRSGDSL